MSQSNEQQHGFRASAAHEDVRHTDRLVARVVAGASVDTGLEANTGDGAGARRVSPSVPLLPGEAAALRYGPPGVPL